jgi:1-acylglycerone phosphate reductase
MPSSSGRKVVLVTGSSAGGIGSVSSYFKLQAPHPTTDQGPFVRSYALCEEFAARNCIVYASARRLAALETLPANVHRIELDVASLESCQKAVNQVLHEQGRIDVLVNNAGAGGAGALLDADVESEEGGKATVSYLSSSFQACLQQSRLTWFKSARIQFEINFWAPLRMSKLVVPHMAQQRSGLIVNIGSIVGASGEDSPSGTSARTRALIP